MALDHRAPQQTNGLKAWCWRIPNSNRGRASRKTGPSPVVARHDARRARAPKIGPPQLAPSFIRTCLAPNGPAREFRPAPVSKVDQKSWAPSRMTRLNRCWKVPPSRRNGHKSRASFAVDERDQFPNSWPSASASPPTASSVWVVSILVFWPSNGPSKDVYQMPYTPCG